MIDMLADEKLLVVGYYLTRCADYTNGIIVGPPTSLEVNNWTEAYDLFFPLLSGGRTYIQFKNHLDSIRNIFDSISENFIAGQRIISNKKSILVKPYVDIHWIWKDRSDNDLTAYVLALVSLPKTGKPKVNKPRISIPDNDANRLPPPYQSIDELQQDAQIGNLDAQFNLGLIYYEGRLVEQDYKAAVKWYTLAANQEDADAQLNLGVMYDEGRGVEQDFTVAVKWITLSAKQGNASAQYNLGLMYRNGQGVVQDYNAAAFWLTLSAKQGDADAQRILGVMYDEGQGLAQDYNLAAYWFELSAKQGDAKSQYNLGLMYHNGQGVAQNHKEAVKWYTLAAEQGDADAQFNLGWIYDESTLVAKNYKFAINWYTLAANQENADAQLNLGVMYDEGRGVEQDPTIAFKWITLASKQGNALAQYNLGLMYANGQGVEKDYKTALKWYTLAAEQGVADAQSEIDMLYASGKVPTLPINRHVLVNAGLQKMPLPYEPIYKIMQKPGVIDWDPPIDIGDTGTPIEPLISQVPKGVVSEPSDPSLAPEGGKQGHTNQEDRVENLFLDIINDISSKIDEMNMNGARLFGLSRYNEAKKCAEVGEKLQSFRRNVVDIKLEWSRIIEKNIGA